MMIDTYQGLRPLAPRTFMGPSGGGGAGTHSPGGGDDKDRRIRRSSTACRECQRRRTKCSGHPKCDECRVHNRECFFDKANDRRRKCFARRTQDQLDYYRRFTEDLISHFRDGDGATVQLIVDTIRSGADNQNLRELLIRLDKAAETEEDPNNQVLDPGNLYYYPSSLVDRETYPYLGNIT